MVKYSEAFEHEETATWRIHIHSLKCIAKFSALLKPRRYIPLRIGYFICLVDKLKMYECLVYLTWTNKLHEDTEISKMNREFMYMISVNFKGYSLVKSHIHIKIFFPKTLKLKCG